MDFKELYSIASSLSKETKINEKSSYGKVAVVCETKEGKIYKGLCFKTTCNVGFCAETAVIAQMILNNETVVKKLVAVYNGNEIVSPCGKCREQLFQLNVENLKCEILLKDKVVTLEELLPES